jgi:hypothetical protein
MSGRGGEGEIYSSYEKKHEKTPCVPKWLSFIRFQRKKKGTRRTRLGKTRV